MAGHGQFMMLSQPKQIIEFRGGFSPFLASELVAVAGPEDDFQKNSIGILLFPKLETEYEMLNM